MRFCKPYLNIVVKAAMEFPKLPDLIASAFPPGFIADAVCARLDKVERTRMSYPYLTTFWTNNAPSNAG